MTKTFQYALNFKVEHMCDSLCVWHKTYDRAGKDPHPNSCLSAYQTAVEEVTGI